MAVHPLRPATDHRLGGPLPRQLPNRTRAHLPPDSSFDPCTISTVVSCGISVPFGTLSPCGRQVAHALLTRPPLRQPQIALPLPPLDLHVLGTPPAFVLSQDQTLVFNPNNHPKPAGFSSDKPRTTVSLAQRINCRFLRFSSLYRFQGPRTPQRGARRIYHNARK